MTDHSVVSWVPGTEKKGAWASLAAVPCVLPSLDPCHLSGPSSPTGKAGIALPTVAGTNKACRMIVQP